MRLIKEAAETGATKLNLDFQKLTELPPELFQLTNLTCLALVRNHLTSLPPEIVQLKNLTVLYLWDTPLVSPPYELAEQGLPAIREYFTSFEEGGQTLAEVKIILTGEGASGKTSLTRCLRGERFDPHETPPRTAPVFPLQPQPVCVSPRWQVGEQSGILAALDCKGECRAEKSAHPFLR